MYDPEVGSIRVRGEEVFPRSAPGAVPPRLSIVVTSRNDDHGGDMLRRMRLCFGGIFQQAEKHRLRTELVLVEWNPPPDRPRLAEALPWPKRSDYCTLRIIGVPPHLHQRYRHADALPLYQMIAKNIGIRRARGEFILATNADILFSDEVFAFMASAEMTAGKMYRADRYDTDGEIPLDVSIEEQLACCAKSVVRINERDGTRNLRTGDYSEIYSACRPVNSGTERVPLYTNACGDFTLLARRHWRELRGYPEWDMFSIHLDSVFCYMAHFGGAPEEILPAPMVIYHLEHGEGWAPAPYVSRPLQKRLDRDYLPEVDEKKFNDLALKMAAENRPLVFNDEDWGLAREELSDDVVVCGHRLCHPRIGIPAPHLFVTHRFTGDKSIE